MNFPRQGKPVDITITGGDREDRYDMWMKLQSYFSVQALDTTFTHTPEQTVIHVYPWAVND